jgi:putative FmdB family regulatory protein
MPTYEYQCKNCQHRFEVWQKMADEPLTVCPECRGTIRRVLFPAGIVFKGSGFYKTDHGSGAVVSENNNTNQSETGKENTAKKESSSESSTSSEKTAAPGASGEKAAVAAD